MAEDNLRTIRHDAKSRGLRWRDVQARYEELKQIEYEARERPNAIRQAAWTAHTTPGCHGFWRHGFAKRYERRLQKSDYTCIPGYDTLAQEIACDFPEFRGDRGCERLWAFLLSPHDCYPTAAELYAQAMDDIELTGRAHQVSDTELSGVPF